MNKQIILSSAYFVATFTVWGLFYMIIYPAIIPLFEYSWLQVFQFSGFVTVCLTYGDYQYRRGACKVKEDE